MGHTATVLHRVSAFYCRADTPRHRTRLCSDEAQLMLVGKKRQPDIYEEAQGKRTTKGFSQGKQL